MAGVRNFVMQLTSEQKKELDEKIRESGYGKCTQVADWVNTQLGVKTSRTAVARYEQALRKKDGVFDTGGSINAMAKLSSVGGELASLYQELGELEYRRAELLEQIRDLMD
ncbi:MULTISPECIES: hypothetical protein [Vibrio]|uniref:hypothetical protein n=2 Tax=Vibrionaceae TaxID=641 RepID=UPI000C84D583|nr:hypothetical protein [Vibrio lentus]PMM35845.1 hypothetical protein BCT58_26030 [Vibrio lentus]